MRWLASLFEKVERMLFYAGLVQRVHNVLDSVLKAANPNYRNHRRGIAALPPARIELVQHQPQQAALASGPNKVIVGQIIDIEDEEDYEILLELFWEAFEREPLSDEELQDFVDHLESQ